MTSAGPVFVDLITPPSSPQRGGGGSGVPLRGTGAVDSAIDLCDSPEPERPPLARVSSAAPSTAASGNVQSEQAGPSAKALGKRKASESAAKAPIKREKSKEPQDDGNVADDDAVHCVEVDAASRQRVIAEPRGDEDDEVVFEGRTGSIALSDFPHARENCLERPWKPGTEADACPNCYCYVCDDHSSKCPRWTEHCKATHRAAKWQAARQQWKICPPAARPPSGAASSSSGSSAADAASSRGASSSSGTAAAAAASSRGEARWSCDRLLKGIEQVYPEEVAEPRGFAAGITLRPYQRQSLAFMLNMERSTDPRLLGMQSESDRGKGLRGRNVRGGWLCDEMGMGKTCVCAALVLATRGGVQGVPRAGVTVVLVNNTLVGQWVDELKKFAPTLKICNLYGGTPEQKAKCGAADVIVSTPHSSPPKNLNRNIHRLIIDESHLYEKGSDPKLPATKTMGTFCSNGYLPRFIWCVTGTPFSNSLDQLETQARMLGHWNHGLRLKGLVSRAKNLKPGVAGGYVGARGHGEDGVGPSNQEVADELKLLMIRHSKSQRIGGEAALSLPDADVATVWLTMSEDERAAYDIYGCADGVPKWADVNRVTDATLADLSSGLSKRRAALAHRYNIETGIKLKAEARAALSRLNSVAVAQRTKFEALRKDLDALRAQEPNVSVVIFTHENSVLADVSEMLRKMDDMTVFQVSRATNPGQRHSALRQFQRGGSGDGARAFCTTFSTAAVGLTLTAASRVYLLEASLDPAQEAQAAGRIHRLGQTKEVLVKRLLFKDSLDEAVDALHQKIKDGDLTIEGGRFPRGALQCFVDHGVANPHKPDPNAPLVEAQRRYRSADSRNAALHGGPGGWDYGRKVQTRPCVCCGKACEIPGTSVWWGKGRWSALNGDTSDNPDIVKDMDRMEPLSDFDYSDDDDEDDDDEDDDDDGYGRRYPYDYMSMFRRHRMLSDDDDDDDEAGYDSDDFY